MTCFTNGNIYRYKRSEDSSGLALVFSAFADNDSILAVPVCDRPLSASIPMLLDAGLVYISVCDAFRLKKEEVAMEVASVDTDSIDTVVQHLCMAFKGYPKTISIPTAVTLPNYSSTAKSLNGERDEISSPASEKVNDRNKYTLDDYIYILKNYQGNMEEIMLKYGLKDRQSVYRVKHTLSKRFGETPDTGAEETIGESRK